MLFGLRLAGDFYVYVQVASLFFPVTRVVFECCHRAQGRAFLTLGEEHVVLRPFLTLLLVRVRLVWHGQNIQHAFQFVYALFLAGSEVVSRCEFSRKGFRELGKMNGWSVTTHSLLIFSTMMMTGHHFGTRSRNMDIVITMNLPLRE